MSRVHMMLQGKGGVGKSFASSMMAQFMVSRDKTPLCIDTDPVNQTFAGFEALNVKQIALLEGDEINTRNFDAMVELIAESKNDVIVDNGASCYQPLSHYLLSNGVPDLLFDMGHEVMLHTVVVGGQSMLDTLAGFTSLAQAFPNGVPINVWLNPYWGPIEHEGLPFEKMKTYSANKARVAALINLPSLKAETFGRDLSDLLQQRLTFTEAAQDATLPLMVRQRLKQTRDRIFAELAKAQVF